MKIGTSPGRRLVDTLVLILVLFHPALTAQEKGRLEGRVVEADSRKPISGVLINIRGSGLKARSDSTGKFEIQNPGAGTLAVEFSCPGFVPSAKEVALGAGETCFIEISLQKIRYDAEEFVTVQSDFSQKDKPTLGNTVPLSGREIVRMPGGVEDLGRALSVLPSVARISNLSNDLIVRGGSPFENGYYVDNIPITNINFFQREGGSGGAYGIISTDLIEDVRFSPGGFSVQYGDRLSSIVDIRLKEGNPERLRTKFDLNVSGFGAAVDGPAFGGDSTFFLSGRISYFSLLTEAMDTGIAPTIGNIHAKWTWTPSPRHKISLLDIYGACQLSMDLDAAVDYDLNHYLDSWTKQNTMGIDWQWFWGDRGVSRTSLSTTYVKNWDLVRNVETGSKYMGRDEGEWITVLRNVNLYRSGERGRIEFGFELSGSKAVFGNYFGSYLDRFGNLFTGFQMAGDFKAGKAGIFFGSFFHLADRLTATAGIRGDFFSYNGHFLLSPRLSLSYTVSPRWTISGNVGIYRQFLYALMLARNPDNSRLRDPRAFHAVLGTEYIFDPTTRLTVEIYAKEYRDFPLTPDDPQLFLVDNNVALSGFTFYRDIVDTGRAYARGIEILFHKKLMEKFYGISSVSMFVSRYSDLIGIWRNRISDNRLIINLMGGYQPDLRWDFSLRWSYGGGIPYTPFDITKSLEQNIGIIDKERIQAERYPAYHSLTLRADRKFQFRRSSLSVYLSLVNAYNRKNVARYYWNRTKHVVEPVYQIPFLPIFGIQYEF